MDLLGFENYKNWTEQFEKKHATSWTQEEILERVRRLERLYWKWTVLCCVLPIIGGVLWFFHPVLGSLLLLYGILIAIVVKLASSNALCVYHILWDIRKGEDEAVRKSEIEDL